MAAAIDPSVKHGPMHILINRTEETGLLGAKELTPAFVSGTYLINLDSEDEGDLTIGCAGGCDVSLSWTYPTVPVPAGYDICTVSVDGLLGGHSGIKIDAARGCANKLLAQTLARSGYRTKLQLISINGGSQRNVISSSAHAMICGPNIMHTLTQDADRVRENASPALPKANLQITVQSTPIQNAQCIPPGETGRIIHAMLDIPHGVIQREHEMNMVRTSNNLAIASSELRDNSLHVQVDCLVRSSSDTDMDSVLERLRVIATNYKGEPTIGNRYPGWAPDPDSSLLARAVSVGKTVFGREPKVVSLHAGLECGIILERIPGFKAALSFGPQIVGAHSPKERVYTESVARTYKFLQALLRNLASESRDLASPSAAVAK